MDIEMILQVQEAPRWSNPCSWLTFDFWNTSIRTNLLVVFLPVFRDEYAHVILQAWVIGYGAGHFLCSTYKRFRRQSNRIPQAVSVSPGFEVGEARTGRRLRFGWILKWLWRSVDGFLHLWFGVGIGIVYTRWRTRQAPHLNWLCKIFLGIAYSRFMLLVTVCTMLAIWCGIRALLRRLAKSPSGDGEGYATS